MAGGVNKVILIGNLGADPELRYTPSGQPVASFRVATSENWVDKDGQKQERTEWHRVVVWGKLGELCTQFLGKGRQAYIEGRLQTREWQDRDGNKRFTTEVVAQNVVFLGGRGEGGGAGASSFGGGGGSYGGGGRSPAPMSGGQEGGFDYPSAPPMDDDVPF